MRPTPQPAPSLTFTPHRACLLVCALFFVAVSAAAQDRAVSFNISTFKTFAPGQAPTIHLYTHNVDALEFRVYKVDNPVRSIENLSELHSFGPTPTGAKERIDERSLLERFHDWKSDLWYSIRSYFRRQFSQQSRNGLRDKQSALSRKSRIVGAAQFAQIPLLNYSRLVARWHQQVPATYISDDNQLAVPKLDAGLYLLEATDGRFKAYTLITVTPWALITHTSADTVLAFVVDRITGAPIAGVQVDAGFGQRGIATGTTGKDGLAQLKVPGNPAQQDNFWIVAGRADNVAVTTPGSYALNSSAGGNYLSYVFTERPVYRPGHTVHWKAILRERKDNVLIPRQSKTLPVAISDQNDKVLFRREMAVSADGTLTGDFDIPKDGALGFYGITIGDGETAATGNFHVEEYRKPEYRVQVTAAKPRVLLGATMPITIDSRYFFGEPVTNAAVKYRVYHDTHYWGGNGVDDNGDSPDTSDADTNNDDATTNTSVGYGAAQESEKTARLDADGRLILNVPTAVDGKGFTHPDLDYTVEAGVTDAANREITGRGRFQGTYSTFHINVETINYGVHPGEDAKFRVTAVDYDNRPIATRVHVQLAYRHYQDGTSTTIDGGSVNLQTDAAGHATGALRIDKNEYSSAALLATASAVVPGTRDVTDEGYVWIMGSNISAADYGSESSTAHLLADKKTYAPGDIAHLSLIADSAGFDALILVTGDTQLTRHVMHSDGRTLSFDVPITLASQPNVSVQAIFLKDNTLYHAARTLSVPPTQQLLQVQITPTRDVFQPGDPAVYDVVTRDAKGNPVRANLSFGVVDEAIYSLYPEASGDMLRRFYPQRYNNASVESSLDYFFSGEAGTKSPMLALRSTRYRPQLAQVKPGNESKPKVRKAFPDTAFWAPDVHTDATGHARVTLTFPDSLTTWRATVHAVTATSQAGSAISRVLVRKNVLVRMGTPRFLRKNDDLSLPVIVHNYLDTAQQTSLSLAAGGIEIRSGATTSVAVASRGEGIANWTLHAAQVGTATLTATAHAPAESDALELNFPILPEGVARSLAQSGIVLQATQQADASFAFPANTDASAHTLRIEASPSIAGSLFSALDYLTAFPYGCTEQTMSSFLPNVIVAQTLGKLGIAPHTPPATLLAMTTAGLDRLKDYQHADGGWGWWKEDDSRVYMTAYVLSGLAQAADLGVIDQAHTDMLFNGRRYLRLQLRTHPKMRPQLRATVVYALGFGAAAAKDADLLAALDAQWSRRSDLDAEALAMTGLAMLQLHDTRSADIAALLVKLAQPQGDLVHWTGTYAPLLDNDYNNDIEATAFAMRLLAHTDSNSQLLPAAAQWLMAGRNGGTYWESTEQTSTVVFGLVDYLAATHELQSDLTVDIVVNGRSAGQRHFTPADTLNGASLTVDIDAQHLQPAGNTVQLIRRSGTGRVYWTSSANFFSTEKRDFQQGSMSLNLTRDYYRLRPVQKDGRIVYALDPVTSGTVNIGDVLAVHQAINGTPMRYLLLEDPIAAGTEFVPNEDSYPLEKRPGGWYSWYTRHEFRDDHAAFFATDFNGRQEIFYLLRVVNPGAFHVSPARVQPMYQHGIQATSDQLLLNVPTPTGASQ